MDKEEYLSIGQFAKLCHIHKKTLFYYDEIGLFKPQKVDENGYRYYSIYQFDKFALISSLKNIGMSLKEIKQYLECDDIQELNTMLFIQQAQIKHKIELLENTREYLNQVIERNQTFMTYLDKGYQIMHCPCCFYETIHQFDPNKKNIVIANYITNGPFLGHAVFPEGSFLYKQTSCSENFIPEGDYLCRYFYGHTAKSKEYIEAMKDYAKENGVVIDDHFYFEINDIFYTRESIESKTDMYYLCLKVMLLQKGVLLDL